LLVLSQSDGLFEIEQPRDFFVLRLLWKERRVPIELGRIVGELGHVLLRRHGSCVGCCLIEGHAACQRVEREINCGSSEFCHRLSPSSRGPTTAEIYLTIAQ